MARVGSLVTGDFIPLLDRSRFKRSFRSEQICVKRGKAVSYENDYHSF